MAIMAVIVSANATDEQSVFERFAVSSDGVDAITQALLKLKGSLLDEAIVLTTCARTEIYVQAQEFHRTVEILGEIVSLELQVSQTEFQRLARVHYAVGAAEHLYRVACGLESRIVGESEILAQVKGAHEKATAVGLSGPVLNRLFREAIEVGKWTRSETTLGSGSTSVGSAGVKIMLSNLEGIEVPKVAVVGTGVLASEVARILYDSGADVTIVARDEAKGATLATSMEARWVPISDLVEVLANVDGAIFATSSPVYLLGVSNYIKVRSVREKGTPLVVVDLSLPRDVAPELSQEEQLTVTDLDGVNTLIERSMNVRFEAVAEVEQKIKSYLDRFPSISASKEISPVIASLYSRAENIRVEELKEFFQHHLEIDTKLMDDIDRLTDHIVKRLLHTPATQLKKVVNGAQSSHIVEDVKTLFGL